MLRPASCRWDLFAADGCLRTQQQQRPDPQRCAWRIYPLRKCSPRTEPFVFSFVPHLPRLCRSAKMSLRATCRSKLVARPCSAPWSQTSERRGSFGSVPDRRGDRVPGTTPCPSTPVHFFSSSSPSPCVSRCDSIVDSHHSTTFPITSPSDPKVITLPMAWHGADASASARHSLIITSAVGLVQPGAAVPPIRHPQRRRAATRQRVPFPGSSGTDLQRSGGHREQRPRFFKLPGLQLRTSSSPERLACRSARTRRPRLSFSTRSPHAFNRSAAAITSPSRGILNSGAVWHRQPSRGSSKWASNTIPMTEPDSAAPHDEHHHRPAARTARRSPGAGVCRDVCQLHGWLRSSYLQYQDGEQDRARGCVDTTLSPR